MEEKRRWDEEGKKNAMKYQTTQKKKNGETADPEYLGDGDLHSSLAEHVALGDELVLDLEVELGEEVDDVGAAGDVDAVSDDSGSLLVAFLPRKKQQRSQTSQCHPTLH
jgi:hypothetical protein